MTTRITAILTALILAPALTLTCNAGSGSPSAPGVDDGTAGQVASRELWGIWNARVIPDGRGSADVVFTPARSSSAHLNVVRIMESSGKPAVGIDPPVVVQNGVLDVDIRLTHPMDDPKFSGFDVRGILIGHGSFGGFTQALFYAGPSDLELLNPDGHTRLWNPTEYTGKGYVDGKLGKPDAIANFTATLNGYKYFADALTPNMAVDDMLKSDRGAFTAGSSNVRHYKIRLGDKGLTFQYAVDANWWPPDEPVEVPGSFDVERANCPEPYHIDAVVGRGIHGGGGTASVTVDIYDWQKDVDTVNVEAPLLFPDVITLSSPQDMGEFLRFSGYLTNESLPATDSADVLVYASGSDPDSGKMYTDYRLFHLPLVRVPDGGVIITVQDDMAYKTIGVEYEYGGAQYDWGAGNPAPVDYNDHTGPWDFTRIPEDNTATRAALSKTDPEVAAFAGDFNSAVTHFWRTQSSIGGGTSQIYQAEAHNEAGNVLQLWGAYEETILEGSVPFEPPLEFPYPIDTDSYFKVSRKYVIIPILLNMTVTYELWGIGEGIAFAPVEPGINGWGWEVEPALLTRVVATIETGGTLGQGVLGTALIYEWLADDGISCGSIMTGNTPGEDPNFDEDTYEIIGTGAAQGLRSIL